MSSGFNQWWFDVGSGIKPFSNHDMEQHSERIAFYAWDYSSVRAADEITRLRAELAAIKAKKESYDAVRAEYVRWWRHWLDTFDGYEGSAWLSEYAKAMPSAHPDASHDVDDVLRRIDFKIGTAVAELAKSNAERDDARLEIVDALKEMHTTAGLRRELKRRGWAEWYMEVKP